MNCVIKLAQAIGFFFSWFLFLFLSSFFVGGGGEWCVFKL